MKILVSLSREMKVTEFQSKLDINSNSFGRFMRYTKPDQDINNFLLGSSDLKSDVQS